MLAATCLLGVASAASAAEYRLGQPVMGTVLQVTVIAADVDAAKQAAEDCLVEARRWDDVLTTWRPEGELARLNRSAGAGPVRISPQLAAALRRMRALSMSTSGAFDPAVGRRVEVLRRPRAKVGHNAAAPAFARALRFVGDSARLEGGVRLDAGAIGKGIALDEMARLLRRRGVGAAFIDFGGSGLYALGSPPEDADGWLVVVGGLHEGEVHGTIALRDASLSTSRSSRAGDAAGPIVDPATGNPASPSRLAVALSSDAAAADAWSTALVVLGRRGLERARKAGIEALFQDSAGTSMTPGFAEKLRGGT